MRLQKLLAAAGFGSRRACEELIAAGRISVKGVVAVLGSNAEAGDDVRLDGKPIYAQESLVYIALHKPVGYISDFGSAEHNKSALDLVRVPQRLFPVGRLDKDSSGLLLLTNDGDLAYRLTHPKFEHEKEYWAWVDGVPTEATLQRWRSGVHLLDESTPTATCTVDVMRQVSSPVTFPSTWLRVVLHEGRKRQIRRVAKLLGHPVKQLVRMRIGALTLGDLKVGAWRELGADEVRLIDGGEV